MPNTKNYLVIDEDATNHLQLKIIIKYDSRSGDDETSLSLGESGEDFFNSLILLPEYPVNTLLVKDIKVPGTTSFQFLERVNKFSHEMKERFKIFILSSNDEEANREIALANPMVSGYFSKPLTRKNILDIVSGKIEMEI